MEALALLGVKPATLYTYVSRGFIRRLATEGRRESLYLREDLERMRLRSTLRTTEAVRAAGAIRYGEPIISTSITKLTPAGPHYRSRSAIELATDGVLFESVAELLWTGMPAPNVAWPVAPISEPVLTATRHLANLVNRASLHDAFSIVTVSAGIAFGNSVTRRSEPDAQLLAARQIILLLTGCFGLLTRRATYRPPQNGETVVQALARALGVRSTKHSLLPLNAALVLSADHELNPATFVARIAASSDGDLHSCITAAINTNSGTRIARGCDRLETLIRSRADTSGIARNLAASEMREFVDSGFNHPLYPDGDPRGRWLLGRLPRMRASSTSLNALLRDVEEACLKHNLQPRLELSLVLLAIALGLPPGAAAGLYTLGRIAGWVAHISEQRVAGFLIRPRAKFVGG